MADHVTRIPFEEFTRNPRGFLRRVAQTGERVEVVWDNGRVALIRPGKSSPGEQTNLTDQADLKPTTRAELDAIFAHPTRLGTPRSWEEIQRIAQEDAADEAVATW